MLAAPKTGTHALEIHPKPANANSTSYCRLQDIGDETWLFVSFSNFGGITYPGGDEVRVVTTTYTSPIFALPPILPTLCKAKTRYRQDDQGCTISMIGPNYSRIEFDRAQWAVTPGQSIVFYQEDVCIGGGIIRSASN